VIGKKAEEKLVAEFNFLRSQSTGTLTKFLDFIAYVPRRGLPRPRPHRAAPPPHRRRTAPHAPHRTHRTHVLALLPAAVALPANTAAATTTTMRLHRDHHAVRTT
jgi:hypothetical protein